MQRFDTTDALREQLKVWRSAGERIALIPTMGNLHQGHVSLIDYVRPHVDRICVSIYINPLQFNNAVDLERYPVTLDADQACLQDAQIDALFLPDAKAMYPYGVDQSVQVTVPILSDSLEGAFRPGHFTGVATIVAKLLNIVQPDVAVFGEKDLQQYLLIRRMVSDLLMPIDIWSAPTVRDVDGLAMSSRNGYLTSSEREQASELYRVLSGIRIQWQDMTEVCDWRELEQSAFMHLQQHGWRPEYISIRHADDLTEPTPDSGPVATGYCVLAAAWLGNTRLIDNIRL